MLILSRRANRIAHSPFLILHSSTSDNKYTRRCTAYAVKSKRLLIFIFPGKNIMNETEHARSHPISVVRFGMGKEIQLFEHELVVTGTEEDQETRVQLYALKRLILIPGD